MRPVTPDDVDGLAALYAGLSVDDLYTRFFSVYRPDRPFLERVAAVADRGGYGLVAVIAGTGTGPVVAGDAGGRIVAEADYEPLDNCDGELAITVAAGWRGWLGPYLLDALIEAAAARGVPNLEADVLVTNAAMGALVRSRGYATMPTDDWVTVRAVIPTAGRVPTWPGPHERRRILVEAPGARWHAGEAAEEAGLDVLVCPGPLGTRTRCPALAGERCPLAAGADAIVVAHDAEDERWGALLDAHRRVHPGVPVCVETPHPAAPVTSGAAPAAPGDEPSVPRISRDAGAPAIIAFLERLARRPDP